MSDLINFVLNVCGSAVSACSQKDKVGSEKIKFCKVSQIKANGQ